MDDRISYGTFVNQNGSVITELLMTGLISFHI